MKPPAKKPVDNSPAKPSRISAKNFPHALEQFEDKLIALGLEFETLEKESYPKVKKIIDGAVPQLETMIAALCRSHSDRMQQEILTNMFEFLNSAPLWETKFIPGLLSQRSEVEMLYRQGWRYLMSAHDPKSGIGGQMYHRPKPPATIEEFNKVYEKMMVAMKEKDAALKQREKYYDEKAKHTKKKPTTSEPVDDEVATAVADDDDAPLTMPPTVVKKALAKLKVKSKS